MLSHVLYSKFTFGHGWLLIAAHISYIKQLIESYTCNWVKLNVLLLFDIRWEIGGLMFGVDTNEIIAMVSLRDDSIRRKFVWGQTSLMTIFED